MSLEATTGTKQLFSAARLNARGHQVSRLDSSHNPGIQQTIESFDHNQAQQDVQRMVHGTGRVDYDTLS